jgi:hypothetical protein
VILLRFPSTARAALPGMPLEILLRHGQKLGDRFVVLQPGRIRLGGNPKA